MRRLGWTPSRPSVDVNDALDNQAQSDDQRSRDELTAVLNDIPAAHQAAMNHLEHHDMRWPIKKTDAYVILNGVPVPTWWVATSTRKQVTFRVTQGGALVTTPMRGAGDIGIVQPFATIVDLDDPMFEDIEVARSLLQGFKALSTSKMELLAAEKQDGRHRA